MGKTWFEATDWHAQLAGVLYGGVLTSHFAAISEMALRASRRGPAADMTINRDANQLAMQGFSPSTG